MSLRTKTTSWPIASAAMTTAAAIAGIIALGILLVLAGANQGNMIVDLVLDIGRWFATPFHDLFPQDDVKQNVLVNWGIAAIVYFLLGSVVARVAR